MYFAGSCFFIASRNESIADSGVVSERPREEPGRPIEDGRRDLRRFVAVGVDPGAPIAAFDEAARGVDGGRSDMALRKAD